MDTRSYANTKACNVMTSLGEKRTDATGVPVSGVRLEPGMCYDQIPELLQRYINQEDTTAWAKIKDKINYLYSNLSFSLLELEHETGFGQSVKDLLKEGKKLLFKPNLLAPFGIDEVTHGEGLGDVYCTQWPFLAAVMRWFHDYLDISYVQMAVGEASPYIINLSSQYSKAAGRNITPEAVIEGRSGKFYGGWGFYFVRKYLSEHHRASHKDNPMLGYEESVAGIYIPPGRAVDRMMVYDLNRTSDIESKGRTVDVPKGANFKQITIHKAIVGGESCDEKDRRDYPGCVLVNLPKLKIHAQDLITNAIKNLGIGLYPTLSAMGNGKEDTSWRYAYPPTKHPNLKAKLPHSPWVIEMDEKTCLPLTDQQGKIKMHKTAGFSGTQSDILRAVQNQGVFMIHITDAITVLNISHDPTTKAEVIPEGYVWASLDCVALDLFCARYLFNTIPMAYGKKYQEEYQWPTEFARHVPVAYINGKNISTTVGLDSPLFLYKLYQDAESRGVGVQDYYIIGWDTQADAPMASVNGHLGTFENGEFKESITQTMYYNPLTMLHDLQLTSLSYAKSNDMLTGTSVYQDIMECFDENGDGIIDYDEKGPGYETAMVSVMSFSSDMKQQPVYGLLRGNFFGLSYFCKYGDSKYNLQGYNFMNGRNLCGNLSAAYQMSKQKETKADRFVPGMTYGNGNWPSYKTVEYDQITGALYGTATIKEISADSLYGWAFQYADKVQNSGGYTTSMDCNTSDKSCVAHYIDAVLKGAKPLSFVLFVSEGHGALDGVPIPNVVETADPEKVFTAQFSESWL